MLETKKGKMVAPLTRKEEVELLHLQSRWKSIKDGKGQRSLTQKLPQPIVITVDKVKDEKEESKISTFGDKDDDSDSDSSSGGESTETFSRAALLKIKPVAKKPPRASVSAEVLGLFNKREDFKPIVVQKDEETKKRIKSRLAECFMFKNLEDKEMNIVVDAMKEIKYKDGDTIIKQGDQGNELYVLESGECE